MRVCKWKPHCPTNGWEPFLNVYDSSQYNFAEFFTPIIFNKGELSLYRSEWSMCKPKIERGNDYA